MMFLDRLLAPCTSLLRVNIRPRHDLAELLHLRGNQGAELGRRHRPRHDALHLELLRDRFVAQRLDGDLV